MKKILILFVVILVLSNVVSALPVFPGAEGFGTDTVAGRGGTVYKVTNLNPSGSGSLKACIDASGPRVCVFEVSGTIILTSDIYIRNPYITIAGQTAPSPGITIRGAALGIITHDVLVQHVRIRVGDGPGPDADNRDGLKIGSVGGDTHNVIIDHCSISWAIDETVSMWTSGGIIRDSTISNTIISEALDNSLHSKSPHSKGLIIGGASGQKYDLTIVGSLFAHNVERNPLIKQDTKAEFINNVVYNWVWTASRLDQASMNAIGNYYKEGLDILTSHAEGFRFLNEGGSHLYVKGNICPGRPTDSGDEWDAVYGSESPRSFTPVFTPSGVTAMSPTDAYDSVLANAGARPADRDSVDERVINDVIAGTGRIIDSQNDVGGWPNLAENHITLNLPSNPNGDDDGYTNLEEWLHEKACEVEGTCEVQERCSDNTPYGQCSTTKPKYCDSGVLVDNCQLCGCPADQSCEVNGSCLEQCESHDYFACYYGDVYWYDSCNIREEKKEECGTKQCVSGKCTISTTVFSTVDTYLGDSLNWEPLNSSRWSVVSDGGDYRYGIITTDYSNLSGSRLGEYSFIKDKTYDDFTFNAIVKSTEDLLSNDAADYNVVLGYQDENNYYYMMFNAGSTRSELFKVVNGNREPIAIANNLAIPDNAYHDVKVERSGNNIKVFFDGALVLEATDSTFSSGRVGIGGYNDASLWDDITVERITECSEADTLPVDGVVDITELMSFIGRWKNNEVTIVDLMTGIGEWKNGC
ncbi:MAG: hypothetical protein ISS23_02125 [Nanoarchaeota archaeon]|nr:hypothetical protein [Nanoarchaeota archaeon]